MIFTAVCASVADLHGLLESRGLAPLGPPTWLDLGGQLSVTIPVLPEYAGNDRPDGSLHALAGELLDWRAA